MNIPPGGCLFIMGDAKYWTNEEIVPPKYPGSTWKWGAAYQLDMFARNMMIHQILEYLFFRQQIHGVCPEQVPHFPPTNGNMIAEDDTPIDLMGCVYENIPPMLPWSSIRMPPMRSWWPLGGAFPHSKRLPTRRNSPFVLPAINVAGKSLVHGGFDGKIIYELAMFATFDYWRVYISPFITLTGWWFGTFYISYVSIIYGMSSFPLTFTPSFLKMVKLHHQPDHSISIR